MLSFLLVHLLYLLIIYNILIHILLIIFFCMKVYVIQLTVIYAKK